MITRFLDAARQGKNHWWRYLCSILLITVVYSGGLLLTAIAAGIIVIIHATMQGELLTSQQLGRQVEHLVQSSAIASYVFTSIPFLFFCLGIGLAVKWIHQRPCRTLISANGSVSWQRLRTGFAVWFLLMCLQTGVDYWLHPASFVITFDPAQWFLLLPLALLLTPIQTSAEEFLFRGYLLQGLGLLTRQPLVLMGMISLPFASAHFANPEMQRGAVWMALLYFSVSVFLVMLTLTDNRLELALGVHAANNLFGILIANTKDSAVPTPALLTQDSPNDPRGMLLAFLITAALFYSIVFGNQNRGSANGTDCLKP